MSSLYVAYGSNLSKRQMRQRCPTSRPLGKFLLKDARLVFRGVADLEFAPGEQAPCGLWSINDDDEKALDMYEGIASGVYFKTREIKLEYAGKRRSSVIYLMNSEAIYPPSRAYADTIRKGYRDFDLDESYLNAAIRRAYEGKAPDEATLARRLRQRSGDTHRELEPMPPGQQLTMQLPTPTQNEGGQ